MATLKTATHAATYSSYRADRQDIHTLTDLKGKIFLAVDLQSFSSWRMAWRELKQAGIEPQRHLK